jgi:regulatory protein YycI of two-component signal transduction system YycFG
VDLSRAKTILIVAFLALNLFLGYRLWFTPQLLQTGQALTGEEVERTREILQSAGYELVATVPRQVPRLSLLHVGREDLLETEWAITFFDENVPGIRDSNGNISFYKEDSQVTVSSNGYVLYRGSTEQPTSQNEDTRKLTERFLQERDIWRDDLKFDYSQQLDHQGAIRYRYVQTYQGFPLFFSTVEAEVLDGRVTEIFIYRVVPLEFSGEDIQVISALDAVEMFLEQEPNFPEKRIIDISLGYFSEDYDAQRWEIVPVWRIASTGGYAVYINAFTGEHETLGR